ncbi:SgcJ/EcaC family oxidoreductase [Tsukamurella spumae]|uniref:SgcJ/EcaC family oxidoreductase n=1 Tax=Tsukamurella spumae TaxID=44753 RepID=A0A846WXS9_9ACTN|nr:SgcJ/EcaC family oxidoreductase [Tsukamurella spumae]NKY18017.1 SgcJ/EcaC family oxidoreductase [Tsukamurella spumae]
MADDRFRDLPDILGDGTPADATAIVEFVSEVLESQREGSVPRVRSLFRDDAVWTTAHGRRLHGRAAIDGFLARTVRGSGGQGGAHYRVERILFIRPDVAAVSVRVRPLGSDGAPQLESAPLYVLSKEGGVWRIAAAQSTAVFDDPAARQSRAG